MLTSALFKRDTVSLEETLKHELVKYPPTLFESEDQLLAATKSLLAKSIRDQSGMTEESEQPDNYVTNSNFQYVVDGGMLLHAIKWPADSSYEHMCSLYYTWLSKYKDVTVVFDGYEDSTKAMCHRKRIKNSCSNITPTLAAKLVVSNDKYLSNVQNKQLFLQLLQNYLKGKPVNILSYTVDADVLMCREAIERCYSGNVSLIGDDTDLLVLLLHMTRHHAFDNKLFLTTKSHIYDTERIRNSFGHKIVNSILLTHAFTGCDTTSRIFGVGKDRLLKILDTVDSTIIDIFYSRDLTAQEVKYAGEQLFLLLLNCKAYTSLDEARYKVLDQQIQSSSIDITCTQLPPSSGAAEQHSYRVFYQIQQWDEVNLNALEWGWKLKNGDQHFPVTTNVAIAPKELLNNVRRSCAKTGCGTSCSCRKADLPCGTVCIKCQDNCTNVPEDLQS